MDELPQPSVGVASGDVDVSSEDGVPSGKYHRKVASSLSMSILYRSRILIP
jgi:hypothetical protein